MEPNRNNSPDNNKPDGGGKRPKGNPLVAILVTVLIVLVISGIFNMVRNGQYKEVTYSDFLAAMESDQLAEVELRYDRIVYLTREEAAKTPPYSRPASPACPPAAIPWPCPPSCMSWESR